MKFNESNNKPPASKFQNNNSSYCQLIFHEQPTFCFTVDRHTSLGSVCLCTAVCCPIFSHCSHHQTETK